MRLVLLIRRFTPFIFLLVAAPLAHVGCGAETDAPDLALRRGFPDQAAQVLESREAFVALGSGSGFALQRAVEGPVSPRVLRVHMPADGAEAIRLQAAGSFEVRVRELGVEGEGTLAGRAVAYRRAGGTSFWTAVPEGIEEWLLLDAGVARSDAAAAAWEVEGGALRQRGNTIDIVDDRGVARLRVTAPAAYTTGGRPVEPQLSVEGSRIELRVDAGGEAVLVDPMWMPTSSMAVARRDHAAAPLSDGRILVAGGRDETDSILASAEIYDPVSDTWVGGGVLTEARYGLTATPLLNGKVLVAGGFGDAALASAELYDPASNAWQVTKAPMATSRNYHTATLLEDGKVLVAGGFNGAAVSSAELYDPVADSWASGGTLATGRRLHAAVRLESGKVLVTGGFSSPSTLASAEEYDPETNSWTTVSPMNVARREHAMALLPSGEVLSIGGLGPTSLKNVELYDPSSTTWKIIAPMGVARAKHSVTVLGDGQVLVAGGYQDNMPPISTHSTTELFDLTTDTWAPGPAMMSARSSHTATRISSNRVLVAGGFVAGGASLASAEIYKHPAPDRGAPCAAGADCEGGFCVDGVCCDTACGAGDCDACSVAAGAALNGTCALLSGSACDDGDGCTQSDACLMGVCTGADPVVCPPPGECREGDACEPSSGVCGAPKPDGTPCSGGECAAGECVPAGGAGSGGVDGGDDASDEGCGCGTSGSPVSGTLWLGLGLLLATRRRRTPRISEAVGVSTKRPLRWC